MTVAAPIDAGTAASRAARVEGWIARVLRAGTLLSVGLLAIGVALMSLAGWSPLDATWPALDLGRSAPRPSPWTSSSFSWRSS